MIDIKLYWDNQYEKVKRTGLPLDDLTPFFPIYHEARRFSSSEKFFFWLIKNMRTKKVLTLGGGVDKPALFLAYQGNVVTSIDLSPQAVQLTTLFGQQMNVLHNMDIRAADWLEEHCDKKYDVIITHDSLHHMDLKKAVNKIFSSLQEGGIYYAMEPICQSPFIRALHQKFPFHPNPYDDAERELSKEDLEFIKNLFPQMQIWYFDFLTRESISYLLHRCGCRQMIRLLSQFDASLLQHLTIFRPLASYVIMECHR